MPKKPCNYTSAGWREVGGAEYYFRSRWEANFARILDQLQKDGVILSWEHEPKTFRFKGISRGCVSYKPDFLVNLPDSPVEYFEVKGYMDAESRTKLRRMAKYFPEIRLFVVGKEFFKDRDDIFEKLIPGWEPCRRKKQAALSKKECTPSRKAECILLPSTEK